MTVWLLKQDLRQTWWTNYGLLSGKMYQGLPAELSRSDLDDVTSQPLLNYLLPCLHPRSFGFH
jgi:hypothetical protein